MTSASILPQVGPYTLIRRLAVGGMGEVFLAKTITEGEDQYLALKRILPHLVTERHFVDRFVDEARLMTALDHPNILPVYELRHDSWGLYMVMEYLSGQDIRTLNRHLSHLGERWPPQLAVWMICEVCKGLAYAHEKEDDTGEPLRLIHRDLSPSNLLLSESGEVKIIDFGVARAHGNLHRSISGALQGKLAYMSPEQARGDELTLQSDLYSLGITLIEMLSGVRPRHGQTDAELLRRAQSDEELRLESLWPQAPPSLCAILNRCVHPQATERFASAHDLGEALTDWLNSEDRQSSERSLREAFVKWRTSIPISDASAPLNLDEAIALQLMGEGNFHSSRNQETLSLAPHVGEKDPLTQSISGLLFTHERNDFSEILDSLIDESFDDMLPLKEEERNTERRDSSSQREGSPTLKKIYRAKVAAALVFMTALSALFWSLTTPHSSPSLIVDKEIGDASSTSLFESKHSENSAPIPPQDHSQHIKTDQETLSSEIIARPVKALSDPQLTSEAASTKTQTSKNNLNQRLTEKFRQQSPQRKNKRAHKPNRLNLNLYAPGASIELISKIKLLCSQDETGKSPTIKQKSSKAERINFEIAFSHDASCSLSAQGYEDYLFRLNTKSESPMKEVTLISVGTLSVRVYPPATKLKLNGENISNPTYQLKIKGNSHLLEGIYQVNGKTTQSSWNFTMKPGERLKKFFELKVPSQN